MRERHMEFQRVSRRIAERRKADAEKERQRQHEAWENRNKQEVTIMRERFKAVEEAEEAVRQSGGDALARVTAGAEAARKFDNQFKKEERMKKMGITQNFYNSIIIEAEVAAEKVKAIKEEYAERKDKVEDQYERKVITVTGRAEMLAEIEAETNEKIAQCLAGFDKEKEAYSEMVNAWGGVDGSRIEATDLALINSGLKLTAAEVQALADKHADNPTMTRVLRQYWDARAKEIAAENKRWEGILNRPKPEETHVSFKCQSAKEKIDIFNRYADLVRHTVQSGSVGDYSNQTDYWKSLASDALGKSVPINGETYDMAKFTPSEAPNRKPMLF